MLSRNIAILLTVIILFTAFGHKPARAQSGGPRQPDEQIRAAVMRLGVSDKTRVEVRLRDNSKLKGHISAADADSFNITDTKTGTTKTVAYADAAQVRKTGGGLSTRAWLIIGAAATAAIIVGATVIKPVLCDGGAGC
ncbi:MAG TPA: hypothetical protein VF525_14860 [Pyrinomonadaceae bacterium]